VEEETPAEPPSEIRCPHCKKAFSADLMAGSAERYRGFKCPHCRLFVPIDRAGEPDRAEPAA
jgi:DNA-directed RNA polymerase subunit RPC12/RpoP